MVLILNLRRDPQRSRRWPRVGLVLVLGLSLLGALLVPVVPVQAQGGGARTRRVSVMCKFGLGS